MSNISGGLVHELPASLAGALTESKDAVQLWESLILRLSTTTRLVAIVLILGCKPLGAAEPHAAGSTRSWEGVVINGRLYIGTGVADRRDPAFQALASLWSAVGLPDFNEAPYRERWKTVAMDQLAGLYGPLPESFHLIYLDTNLTAECGFSVDGVCASSNTRVHQADVRVQGAEVYLSGCDGDLVSLLDLGPWPWGDDSKTYEAPSWEWPEVLVFGQREAASYVLKSAHVEMVPGRYRPEQRFRREQFLLFDEKREWYLQLDWVPYEIETSEIYLKAGRDEQALKEVNVETVFRGRC